MPDYEKLYNRLSERVYFALQDLEQQNYGRARERLRQALEKGAALENDPPAKIPPHSTLGYIRRNLR